MPGLRLFNRRWEIGSDDLMFPAFADIWLRLAWIVALSLVIDNNKHSFSCTTGDLVQIYYYGMLIISAAHAILDITVMIISSRGSIMNTHPRRHIHIPLYMKLSVCLPELLLTVLGTYWAFDHSSNCSGTVVLTVKIAALIGWLSFIGLLIGLYVVFDPLGHHSLTDHQTLTANKRLWEQRCRLMCCCANVNEQATDAFKDIAKMMTKFFSGTADVVVTDVAAGLILVHHAQHSDPPAFQYTKLPSDCIQTVTRRNIAGRPEPAEPNQTESEPGSHVTLEQQSHDHVTPEQQSEESHVIPVQQEVLVDIHDPPSVTEEATDINVPPVDVNAPPANIIAPPANVNVPPTLAQNIDNLSCDSPDSNATTSNTTKSESESESQAKLKSETETSNDCCDYSPLDVDISQQQSNKKIAIAQWMTVHNAAYYMKYALATYTWPLYVYMNLCCGFCRLWKNCRCCSCHVMHEGVAHDNCCTCHTSAILKFTGGQQQDVVYASFYDQLYEIPFLIMVDHKQRSVVIAVRGTMSFTDAVTDLCADSECCDFGELGSQFVHKGILQAARYIQRTITNLNLLERAFQKGPDYRLVVTGHSLGAGAATLLALFLRPAHPDLICFAYSPPGWLLSLSLAQHTERFVCSVVLGRDVIPRLGVATMHRLQAHVHRELHQNTAPKYRILAGGCWRVACGASSSSRDGADSAEQRLVDERRDRRRRRLYTEEQEERLIGGATPIAATPAPRMPTGGATVEHASIEVTPSDAAAVTNDSGEDDVTLYMPGVVLFIEEEDDGVTQGCLATPVYRPVWSKAENFNDIIVHPRMLSDHFPDVVMRALTQLDQRGQQAHYMMTSRSTTS